MSRTSITLFDLDEDRGVSPVIGVILMVAITVILAAVIGTFVLGLGENVSQSTPQAQLTLSANADNIVITHKGGDPITANTIKIKLTNSSDASMTFSPTANSKLTVGDTATIYTAGDNSYVQWPTGEGDTNVTAMTGGNFTIQTGESYNLKVIHKDSQQLIADQNIIP